MSRQECDTNCGRVQLPCESVVKVKPSMTKIVGERFKVTIKDYTTYCGSVVVKGYVEKITMYLHELDHKNVGDKQGHGHKDHKECDKMTTYCQQVDYVAGVVHYLESTLEFNAVVEIPDVKCGDRCHVTAHVKEVGDFVAIERDHKGHVTKAEESYLLDIKVCCSDQD